MARHCLAGEEFQGAFNRGTACCLSKAVNSPVLAEAKKQGAVLGWGNFLTVVVNFLIVAFVLFLAVRALNKLKKPEVPAAPPAPPRSEVLLERILDALATKKAEPPSASPASPRSEALLGEIRDLLAKQ